jgi:hypothetical protein
VWMDQRDGLASDLYAQRLGSDGSVSWTHDGVLICGSDGEQDSPRLVRHDTGDVAIVWTDHRGPSSADVYAQRIDSLGGLRWVTDGIPVCDAGGPQYAPTVVSVASPSDGIVVSWVDERSVETGPDIFAQRIDPYGAMEWATNGVAVCVAPDYQFPTAGLALADGSVILCWPDSRNGLSDLYATRVDLDGNSLWGANGLPIAVAPYGSWDPQIVSDNAGGAIIAWADDRNDAFVPDIYAQRIQPDGDVLWPANGVVVSNAPFDQFRPQLLPDGVGGVIATWEDWRDGGLLNQRYKIFAQRVAPDGTPTSVRDATPSAHGLRILETTPNPLSSSASVMLDAENPGEIEVQLYSVTGRLVFRDTMRAVRGHNSYLFQGLDAQGRRLPSGIYFLRLRSGLAVANSKLVIAR